MYGWIIKIAISAVFFNFISYLLPNGKTKNVVIISFSFMFLTFVVIPLKDAAFDVINKRFYLESERNLLISQLEIGDSDAYYEVLNTYKQRIETEIKKELVDKGYDLIDMKLTLNEDFNTEHFGEILGTIITVKKMTKKDDNIMGYVTVPDIIIDLDGVRIENKNNAENSENLSKDNNIIYDVICKATGLDRDRIKIRWEE